MLIHKHKLLIILSIILGMLSCNGKENNTSNNLMKNNNRSLEKNTKNLVDSLSPQIIRYDPKTTFAGMDFNVHEGKSVIWMEVKNLKKSVIVVWEGRQLPADKNPELTLLSFVVPKELYSEPGSYEIYLLDTETGLKSKNVYFTVQ